MVHHRKWQPYTWNVARAIYIMWSKHLQSLKLLHPTIEVEMYLQENIVYKLDCDIKVTWNIAKNSKWVWSGNTTITNRRQPCGTARKSRSTFKLRVDALTHKIWNSYLKEYWRYAPDSIQFLETRSEVKFKVTETQLYYLTLCHPKMHLHTDFEIPTSNNIRDMLRTRLLKKTRSEVKVTMTCKWYVTLRHPKKHLHTKFGIPISKNIGDMHQTRCSF